MTRRLQAAVIVLSTILAMAFLHLTSILTPAEDWLREILSPIGYALNWAGGTLRPSPSNVQTLSACRDSLSDMEKRLAAVSVDYVHLRALEGENEVLRTTLGYLQKESYDAVMARVISRSVDPGRSVIMIDKGSKDGLENGMAVIVGDGIFIGKITTIRELTSVVTLVTDPQSRVAIAHAGEHRLIGIAQGNGSQTAEATLIPQQESLVQNDILVTAGTEEKIPADLAVGLVNKVSGQLTDPFKSATIEPLLPSDRLQMVAVLRPQVLRPK